MAACKSLQHIFENPLPDNPTLMETLSSWSQIKSMKPPDQPSFTEIFGELHFKENSDLLLSSLSSSSSSTSLTSSSTSSTSSLMDFNPIEKNENSSEEENKVPFNLYVSHQKKSESFSPMKSESLQLCTEGLGFESCDDVEHVHSEIKDEWENQEERVARHSPRENTYAEVRRSRIQGGAFPPPISSIGKTGKPWVCFKSYRHDGRFVLKEIRIPNQELLHACREDGRLKLHFVQPDEEQNVEDIEDEDEYDDNEENGEHEAEISHEEAKDDSCLSPFQGSKGNCK